MQLRLLFVVIVVGLASALERFFGRRLGLGLSWFLWFGFGFDLWLRLGFDLWFGLGFDLWFWLGLGLWLWGVCFTGFRFGSGSEGEAGVLFGYFSVGEDNASEHCFVPININNDLIITIPLILVVTQF